MDYRLDPGRPLSEEVRRVALECLDDAIERLRHAGTADRDLEKDVHQSRKRAKETRGLIRLVRPALGDAYAAVNAEVRDGAGQLSSLRDAHALRGTVEDLTSSLTGAGTDDLDVVAGQLRAAEAAASGGVDARDARIAVARSRFETARVIVETWPGTVDVHTLTGGVTKTVRRGRAAWKSVRKEAEDEEIHAWRKGVKYLWYQAQLLLPADPQGIAPMVEDLDELSDLLGDEHDLTVLVEHLERSRHSKAMADVDVKGLIELARSRQATLRSAALDLGKEVYGDGVDSIVARLVGPWSRADGPTGVPVERERKFLVADMPEVPDEGTQIRQGYLAVDDDVQVRIRERAGRGRSLTVKGGHGRIRTEVELSIGAGLFDQLWPLTAGRRIEKTRYVIPLDGAEAELDVFAGVLDGLVLVEVEFGSDQDMTDFEAPGWFGDEVTDDRRYSNAALARRRPGAGAAGVVEGRRSR